VRQVFGYCLPVEGYRSAKRFQIWKDGDFIDPTCFKRPPDLLDFPTRDLDFHQLCTFLIKFFETVSFTAVNRKTRALCTDPPHGMRWKDCDGKDG